MTHTKNMETPEPGVLEVPEPSNTWDADRERLRIAHEALTEVGNCDSPKSCSLCQRTAREALSRIDEEKP